MASNPERPLFEAGRGRRAKNLRPLNRASARIISRVTWAGLLVNVGLVAAKGLAGWQADSRTLMADAVHSLSDLITDAAVLVGVRYWAEPADDGHPYGHGKIETLVALFIGLALAAVGLALAYGALKNLGAGRQEAAAPASALALWSGLAAALVSIMAKEALYRWTAAWGAALKSSALVANAWHHRSDALSSIPPVVTLGIAAAGHDLWYLDSAGTVAAAMLLLMAAWEAVKPTLATLMDASADRRLGEAIRETALAAPGVLSVHKLRTRFLGSGAAEVDLHIMVDGSLTVAEGHRIAAQVKYLLLALDVPGSETRVVDVLVHMEPALSPP